MNPNGQSGKEDDGEEEDEREGHSEHEAKRDTVPELVAEEDDLIEDAKEGPDEEDTSTDEDALNPPGDEDASSSS